MEGKGSVAVSLSNAVAIVTGGGKGIGAGISKALAAAGAKVLIIGKDNMEMAVQTASEIRECGGVAETMRFDLQNDDTNLICEYALECFGGESIDILVNNAAYQPNLDIDEYDEVLFDKVLDINLFAYTCCIKSVIPYMKKSVAGGSIINVSSIHAFRPGGFDVVYSMTKAAIHMLTMEAALELAPYGIKVNTLMPGSTRIEFKSGEVYPFKIRSIKRDRAYKIYACVGDPKDTGDMVVYLCTQGRHVNGTSVVIDGGYTLY